MPKADALRARIEAFPWARNQEIVVTKAGRGYSLLSARTGEPVARLKPIGEDDKVLVLWWNGQRWGASGPLGIVTMPLDKALAYIAAEPDFWIHA